MALQGTDGQWAGGKYWAAADDDPDSQPWTAITYSLLLLRDFGLDPESREARHATGGRRWTTKPWTTLRALRVLRWYESG